MEIIIDTNFLLIPFTLNVDIFSQFREMNIKLNIIDRQIDELNKLKEKGSGSEKLASKLVIEAISRFKINIVDPSSLNIHSSSSEESFKKVDTVILETAKSLKFGVATQDKELKKRLREEKIPVYYLRQKKYITRD